MLMATKKFSFLRIYLIRLCQSGGFSTTYNASMKLKTKIWLVSQGLLILTACIIQLTFYHEIKYGPILGMAKRPYWQIISDAEPTIPPEILAQGIGPELYDGRLPVRRSSPRPQLPQPDCLSSGCKTGAGHPLCPLRGRVRKYPLPAGLPLSVCLL